MDTTFRKIDPKIWNDEKVRTLRPLYKLGFLYLLTSPHTSGVGVFHFDPLYMAADMNLSAKSCHRFLKMVTELGLVGYIPVQRLVWFPNWWKYNRPKNKETKARFLRKLQTYSHIPELHNFISELRRTGVGPAPDGGRETEGEGETETETERERETEGEEETEPNGASSAPPAAPAPSADTHSPLLDELETLFREQHFINEIQKAFPDVPIKKEKEKLRARLMAEPVKNLRRFVYGWMRSAQRKIDTTGNDGRGGEDPDRADRDRALDELTEHVPMW